MKRWLPWVSGLLVLLALVGTLYLLRRPRPELPALPPGAEMIYYQTDPIGDDYGPGRYTYPTHPGFSPHDGLFDLWAFRVSADDSWVYFDLVFGALTNPWKAPEGFFHQLVDIYIDTKDNNGRTETLAKGANVAFSEGWEICLKVRPFGRWALIALEKGYASAAWLVSQEKTDLPLPVSPSKESLVKATRVGQTNTIRIQVPKGYIGQPVSSWRYYVLIGGFDVFGPDFYRVVQQEGSEWHFGGAEGDLAPNVIDVLAPGWGRDSQRRMLRARPGSLPVLHPVGGSDR